MSASTNHSRVVALDGSQPGDRELFGGKALSVNRMRSLGLPVPPAFVLPTTVCGVYHGNDCTLPPQIWADVMEAVRRLEVETGRTFGKGPSPLLVSVRSGAAQSMPGMMDTVLNLGLTTELVAALAAESGDDAWARDTWDRFRRSYAEIVLGAEESAGAGDPPEDAHEQLRAAIGAVFDSWTNERVRAYRERHRLGEGGGTAVTVQAMVFGNRDEQSGTGVMFSRDPSTGEAVLYGEYLRNAQGEDVVSGETTPQPLTAVRDVDPMIYAELERVARTLESEHRDLVDIEFTIESGTLYMLQCRAGKRSPQAALRVAAELAAAGTITPAEALERITEEHVESVSSSKTVGSSAAAIATGSGACPGVATGYVATTGDEVDALVGEGKDVILVRTFTSPDDVPSMFQSVGVLTEVGGATSHAALVAREIGMACVVGAGAGLVERLAGTVITIDGSSGQVYEVGVEVSSTVAENPHVQALLGYAVELGATEHPIHRLGRTAEA